MAKFMMECPKCGSLNTASTFIFSKKLIQCGTCGEEINVKQSRLTSKKCTNCGKVVVCDQAKLKDKKCPSCGEPMGIANATSEYKMTEIVCPQCSCQIEIDKTQDWDTCPICDMKINVKQELTKEKQVSDTGISVIKYEGDNSTFVWKHPIEDFNLGSQLIVHESQEAIFFLDGQALDLFGPGRHVLETENLPVLKKIYTLPTDRQNPFHAEVYFINKTIQMGIKWGTDSRVRFIEPNTGIPLDIGASGEMNLQVSDARKLLVKLVGTTGGLTRNQILEAESGNTILPNENSDSNARNVISDKNNNGWSNVLKGYFRPLIMTTVKTNLASVIKREKINILEIDEQLEALSKSLREKVSEGFKEYGLFIPQFYVTNVSLPEDDKNFKRVRDLMAATYLGVREAEVEANIVAARRQIEIEKETTLTEKAKRESGRKIIEAQGEAEVLKTKGTAINELRLQKGLQEAEVMKAKGYTQQEVMQAEVQKAYAEGIGNMGSNGGGSGVVSDIVGLGAGLAAANIAGGQIGGMFGSMYKNNANNAIIKNNNEISDDGWKCICGCENNRGKYCSECGNTKPEMWDCKACGNKGIIGNYCTECGKPKPEIWKCVYCGTDNNIGKFCTECGKPREENNTWNCDCGNKGITGKFCSECGKKREDNK